MIYDLYIRFMVWLGAAPPSGYQYFLQENSLSKMEIVTNVLWPGIRTGFETARASELITQRSKLWLGMRTGIKAAIVTELVVPSPLLITGMVGAGVIFGLGLAIMIGPFIGLVLVASIVSLLGIDDPHIGELLMILGILIGWLILGIIFTILGALLGLLMAILILVVLSIKALVIGGIIAGIVTMVIIVGANLIDKELVEGKRSGDFNTVVKIVGGVSGIVSGIIGVMLSVVLISKFLEAL